MKFIYNALGLELQVYLDSTRGQNYLAMLYDHKAGSECGQSSIICKIWRNDRILWTGFKFCFLQNCNKIVFGLLVLHNISIEINLNNT